MFRLLLCVFTRQSAYALFTLSLGLGIGEWVAPGVASTLFPVWLLPVAAICCALVSADLHSEKV